MEPVLLFKEQNKIADEAQTLKNFVPVFQGIYDALKGVGVSATLSEINGLIASARGAHINDTDFIKNYVLNKMTVAAMPHIVNGITYPYLEVRKLITLPDISAIKNAFGVVIGTNYKSLFEGTARDIRLNLLTLVDGVVSEITGAYEWLESLFSHYTKTDASTAIAKQLQAVCNGLNEFNKANGGLYFKRIPNSNHDQFNNLVTEIPGIARNSSEFIVSPTWVKKFEQLGTLHF